MAKSANFPVHVKFFLSVTRLQVQFKLNASINHWVACFHQLLVRLVVSSEFWATFNKIFCSMVNSAVFNRVRVKYMRIICKLILLIAAKIFNKYFTRSSYFLRHNESGKNCSYLQNEIRKWYEQSCREIGRKDCLTNTSNEDSKLKICRLRSFLFSDFYF